MNEPGDDGRDPTVEEPPIPEWDDEYVDRVADRLMTNYDLEKDERIAGERFTLTGTMRVHSRKQFFHPALAYAHQEAEEHLFVKRVDRVRREDVDRLVALGHDLADRWIVPDDEHFSTDFTFVLLTEEIPETVRSFVSGFSDRTLLRYGYHGHYEVNLVVVAPEREELVASDGADVARAFSLWEPVGEAKPGFVLRLLRRLFLRRSENG